MFHTKSNYSITPRNFSNLVEGIFNDGLNQMLNNEPDMMNVPVNIKEGEQSYELHLVAPGLNKEDFKIQIDKNTLTISFTQKEEDKEESSKWLRNEYRFRSFKRSFKLNDKINTGGISAKYADGILNITLPKNETTEQKTQEISVA